MQHFGQLDLRAPKPAPTMSALGTLSATARRWATIWLLTASLSSPSLAQTLNELLERAYASEPTMQSARRQADAAQAKERQAARAFHPQISASVNTHKNAREYRTRIEGLPLDTDEYNSHTAQVTLTQPLWRQAEFSAWEQAEFAHEQARRSVTTAEQDLAVRLLTAWFDLLAARDQQAFADQQEIASRLAFETARRGNTLGTTSAPQQEEAAARLELAKADREVAAAEVCARVAVLEQLVGPLGPAVINADPTCRPDALKVPVLNLAAELRPDRNFADWLASAEADNPALVAARLGQRVADEEWVKQQLALGPTLDLVSSISRNGQGAGGFPGQMGYDIVQRAVGLQFNMPLYSGVQMARVDEALAQQEKARQDTEAARRAAVATTRQAWAAATAAQARLTAGQRAVTATALSLRNALTGHRLGLRPELEVEVARQQWLAARRDSLRAAYDLLLARARLAAASGRLDAEFVGRLDRLFQPEAPAVARADQETVAR